MGFIEIVNLLKTILIFLICPLLPKIKYLRATCTMVLAVRPVWSCSRTVTQLLNWQYRGGL